MRSPEFEKRFNCRSLRLLRLQSFHDFGLNFAPEWRPLVAALLNAHSWCVTMFKCRRTINNFQDSSVFIQTLLKSLKAQTTENKV